ncbi:MAG: alpha/beta hydrolase, partial [Bacteroidota bacterium]
VIAYDLRGHGGSMTTENAGLEIDDLNTILQKEAVNEKINLVGCSLGAIIALDYSIAHPDRLDKLVLVSPGLIGHQETNTEFLSLLTDYVTAIQQGDKAQMIAELKKMNALGKTNRSLNPAIESYVNQQLNTFIDSGNYLRIPNFKEASPISQLQSLDLETLVLYGELDFEYIADNAKVLRDSLENAQLMTFENAAHLINLEAERKFNQTLFQFLELR